MSKIENTAIFETLNDAGVADIYVYDAQNGMEYISKTLDKYSIGISSEEEKISAGIANSTIFTISKGVECTLSVDDVAFKRDWNSLKFGSILKKGNVNVRHMPKYYDVKGSASSFTVTLDKTPKEGEVVSVYNPETKKMITAEKVAIEGTTLTITDTLKAGQKVQVGGFMADATNVEYTEIGGTGVAPNVAITLEKPLLDGNNRVAYIVQYNFFKCAISSSATLEGTAEKGKAVQTTEFTPLFDEEQGCIGHIVYIVPEQA